MQIYLHPTRAEALTVSEAGITRWSLATNPAMALAQFPTLDESILTLVYDQGGRPHPYGGVTVAPDGLLFAHGRFTTWPVNWNAMSMIDWRRWDDFSLVRTESVPYPRGGFTSLACSPDGRWLVLSPEYAEQIVLLDWQTGEVVSHHAAAGGISGLAFDSTSSFVAAFACNDNWGHLMLWRIIPAERFIPRPQSDDWWARDTPPDVVSGAAALSVVHWELDRSDIKWPDRELADTVCQSAFSPDSRMAVFSPMNSHYSGCGLELVAYEVASGKRVWWVRREQQNSGPFIFSPDGSVLLVPLQSGKLLIYRADDGTVLREAPTELSEPVQALIFDHTGATLWLATSQTLVQHRPQG